MRRICTHVIEIPLGNDDSILHNNECIGVGAVEKVLQRSGLSLGHRIGQLTEVFDCIFKGRGLTVRSTDRSGIEQRRHMPKAVPVVGWLIPVGGGISGLAGLGHR